MTVMAVAAATQDSTVVTNPPERFATRVLVSGLEGPWEVAWGPDQQLWVTERTGRRVVRINPADGSRSVAATIPEVNTTFTQDGLLGLAFHADLLRGTGNDFVYVAFTYDDAAGPALARRLTVRRYRYDQASRVLVDPLDILTGLPTHTDHVGGRLAFGPDRKLYLTIGDQGSNFGGNRCDANHSQTLPTAAQVRAKDWSAYQGKILRLDLDGSIPSDNPEIGGVRSHVFSVGHRNPLGLAFGPNGRLYESEHGPSSDDEANLIEGGRNYGWPNVAGYNDGKGYVYANWSASSPAPCASLPPGGAADPRVGAAAGGEHVQPPAVHAAPAHVLHRRDRLRPEPDRQRDDRAGRPRCLYRRRDSRLEEFAARAEPHSRRGVSAVSRSRWPLGTGAAVRAVQVREPLPGRRAQPRWTDDLLGHGSNRA